MQPTEEQIKIADTLKIANVYFQRCLQSNQEQILRLTIKNKRIINVRSSDAIHYEIKRLKSVNMDILQSGVKITVANNLIKNLFKTVNNKRQYNLMQDSQKLMQAAHLLTAKDKEIAALKDQLNELYKQL